MKLYMSWNNLLCFLILQIFRNKTIIFRVVSEVLGIVKLECNTVNTTMSESIDTLAK
jgi:hypothetical protein